MKFEEIMQYMREGRGAINGDWNGNKLPRKLLYVTIQKPDSNSMNTEPYFVFNINTYNEGVWDFKKFPWIPSMLDLFSENWEVRELMVTEEKD